MTTKSRNDMRRRRHHRVRRKIEGTSDRPRLNVFRSLTHIYAQLIDDAKGETLAAASTLDPDMRSKLKGKSKTEQAKLVGELIRRADQRRASKLCCSTGAATATTAG